MRLAARFYLMIGVLLIARAAFAVPVYYMAAESGIDHRSAFPLAVLRLALSKSCRECVPVRSADSRVQNRLFMELGKPNGMVDVVWSVTNKEREQKYRPIRIPIDKGLIGWRKLLVTPALFARLDKAHTLADLRKFSIGQGEGWPDVDILRANGFTVIENSDYDGLFQMLMAGRFELFPRSVIEIGQEAQNYPADMVKMYPRIILHYPNALYFFVRKDNLVLARKIEQGFAKARRDGSYERLFNQFYAPLLHQLKTAHYRVFELDNPLLPSDTPLHDPALWFSTGRHEIH